MRLIKNRPPTKHERRIWVAVLSGEQVVSIAEHLGISFSAVRCALHRFCEKTNPERYKALMRYDDDTYPFLPLLTDLRENASAFVGDDYQI